MKGRICASLCVLLLTACAAPPASPPAKPVLIPEPPMGSYVVLLQNDDGSLGALSVTGPLGTALVDRLAQGARLDGSPPFAVEESRIRRDFDHVLAVRPPAPLSFLLYFETGGAQLTSASQALIPQVVTAIKARPAPDVSVIGHTDTEGDDAINEKLGLTRAQAIAKLLTEAGLPQEHVSADSHGKRNLLVPTPDNTPEPRNRRVEITIR
jgi:outer membrane protein OmpA-like peptidoglycan-associated protein